MSFLGVFLPLLAMKQLISLRILLHENAPRVERNDV